MNDTTQRTPVYRHDLIRSAVVNKDLTKVKLMADLGFSPSTVLKLWHGKTDIKLETLMRLADYLGLTLHELFTPAEPKETV